MAPLELPAGNVAGNVDARRTGQGGLGRSAIGTALPVAVGGAALSAAGEAWHAYSHLRLDTHSAPVAGILSFVGFLVVVIAMTLSRRAGHRRPASADERRAA